MRPQKKNPIRSKKKADDRSRNNYALDQLQRALSAGGSLPVPERNRSAEPTNVDLQTLLGMQPTPTSSSSLAKLYAGATAPAASTAQRPNGLAALLNPSTAPPPANSLQALFAGHKPAPHATGLERLFPDATGAGADTVPTWQARAADYYGDNAVHTAAPEPIADEEPSELDQLLASLGVAPNRGDYVRPYDEAEGRANAAYQAAGPSIASTYDQLRQQIAGGQTAADARQAQFAAGVSADQNAARSTIEQLQAAGLADLKAQGGDALTPSLVGGAQVNANQNIANLLARGDSQRTLMSNTANAEDQSLAGRKLDADAGQAAAASNARTNLDSILNQIGLGRANAERQFQGDTQDRAQQEAGIRLKYHEAEIDRLNAEQKKADEMAKALDKVSTTPAKDFANSYAARAQRFPLATQVFEDITRMAKGKGQVGLAQALRILEAAKPALAKGQYSLDDDTPIRARIDSQVLANWLHAFYDDETKRPNRDALAQLGIDPSALGL